ncbi:MAG: hypothetical protein Ct9H300mP11_30040 [Chloroflexota bacterium]|nr:MAG: hypothetical protein Ct9H300mP11_30040 [Chloroflexota bacterium]
MGREVHRTPVGPSNSGPSLYSLVRRTNESHRAPCSVQLPEKCKWGLGPMLKDVQTPMLMLAAATLREEVLGDFGGASDLFPNGRKVIFPGVQGFVQHIMPVPCARIWLDFPQKVSRARNSRS